MKFLRSSLIGLTALCALIHAPATFARDEPADVAKSLIDTALASDLGYKIIESLTTEIGPRPAGSAADPRGIAWGVAKFKELGFDNVRTEPVKLTGWARGAESARITAPFAQPLTITSLGGSVATPEKGVEAQIIAFPTVEELSAADPKDIKGKIVFLHQKMTRAQDGSGYGAVNINRRMGANVAGKMGALAVVIRSIGTDSHRLPHTGQMAAYEDGVRKIPAGAISNPDADLVERIIGYGEPVKMHVTLTPRDLGGVTTYNVIGEITGSEKPDEIVLIGGHLDSWDLGTGAVDDGAGIGITTAAAALIGQLETAPKRTIRVVMYGAEEVGLIGARAYMAAHADELDKHVIAAESDFGAGRIWAIASNVGDASLPAFKDMARVLRPLQINFRNNSARGGPDVGMLNSEGVPVAALMQDGTDYFDLHHTADDTFDKIDPANIRQNVAAYAAFAYMMAQLDVDWRAQSAPAAPTN